MFKPEDQKSFVFVFLIMESQINPLLHGLLYPSETDEPVTYFSVEWPGDKMPLPGQIAALLGKEGSLPTIEHDPSSFWEPVTTAQPWHSPEEQERTRRFMAIRENFEEYLTQITYFEVGRIEITLLLVGLFGGQLCGLVTKAVHT